MSQQLGTVDSGLTPLRRENPAPRSTREEPFVTRTNLEGGRARGRNREVTGILGHRDGEQVPRSLGWSRQTGVFEIEHTLQGYVNEAPNACAGSSAVVLATTPGALMRYGGTAPERGESPLTR